MCACLEGTRASQMGLPPEASMATVNKIGTEKQLAYAFFGSQIPVHLCNCIILSPGDFSFCVDGLLVVSCFQAVAGIEHGCMHLRVCFGKDHQLPNQKRESSWRKSHLNCFYPIGKVNHDLVNKRHALPPAAVAGLLAKTSLRHLLCACPA